MATKLATTAKFTRDHEFGIVAHKYMFDDRKTEPGTAAFARAALVDAEEALCETRTEFRVNPFTGIGYNDGHFLQLSQFIFHFPP